MKLHGVFLAALLTGSSLSAAQFPLAEDAKAFGAREAASRVALSPSGDKVVMLVAAAGRATVAKVFDLRTGAESTALMSRGDPESLDWCKFASETRLVCRFSGNLDLQGVLAGFGRLVTVGIDGKDLKPLGQRQSVYDNDLRQYDGSILDWLPGQDGAVLMARQYVPEAERAGSHIARKKEGLAVDRIDLRTLKSESVEPADRVADSYLTDGKGSVRLKSRQEADHDGLLTGVISYSYRRAGSREWEKLGQYDSRTGEGINPLAIEADSNALFVLRKLNGRDALYRMALDGTLALTLVAKNDRVDINGVQRFGRGQKVISYSYSDDHGLVVFIDPEFDKLSSSLGRALPSAPQIDFSDSSADGNTLLIFAGSDIRPGTYYILDRKTRQMSELVDVRPVLKGRTLSPMRAVQYKARDGVTIPAYVTVPAGTSGKGLPAVVLPHGGPSARDEWGFDWLPQFLAARGYVVIQPNYRGSSGYGDEFENENGFRNWQTSIADISDAARYLVAEGIADKDRLAIVGWSYGGYAALQSAAVEPDLYRSVVAIAPVTDLAMLKRQALDYTHSELVKDFVGSGEHVRAGSPLRNAASIKAPVLLVHGDLDLNVDVQQSVRMAAELKSAGKSVDFLRYKGLDHQLEDIDARTEMLARIGDLLDRTLNKK